MEHMSTTTDKRETLQSLITNIRRLLDRLERLGARDGRSIDRQILDALEDIGPASTAAIRRLVRRKASDVRTTLRLLREAGKIRRDDATGKWEVADVI
jgi:hypothetical protein